MYYWPLKEYVFFLFRRLLLFVAAVCICPRFLQSQNYKQMQHDETKESVQYRDTNVKTSQKIPP